MQEVSNNRLLILSNEVDKMKLLDGGHNSTVEKMVKILGNTVPETMSVAIANYTMATFVGHFHYKIELERDNLIPMNTITFILAKSGAKKTSSMLKLEKALKLGYGKIQKTRVEKAEAIKEEFDLEHLPYIPPLSSTLATEAGLIQRLNDFAKEGIGLPSLYVDEISTELASNPDMIPNIKVTAQLFDVGDMKSKPLKDRKNQSDEVHGMGMNVLLIGSEHGILEDKTVLARFETEVVSKLGRRCIFVYPEFEDEEDTVESIEDMLKEVAEKRYSSLEINKEINDLSAEIANKAILNDRNTMKLSDECSRAYTVYMLYCEAKVQTGLTEAVILEQQHRHWKALKLAGVYAVFNKHDQVEEQDLKEAIFVVENTGSDLGKFMEKANRLPYEILLEHYQNKGDNLTPHQMVKKGWINKLSDVKNIVELANSKSGKTGMLEYSEEEGEITYQSFAKSGSFGLSYKKTGNLKELIDSGMGRKQAKQKLASQTATGFKYYRVNEFKDAVKVMKNDTAYTPFKFRNGIRGNDHIDSGADFIVLDVDETDISWTECFDMLGDYNCAIALGSDENNPYKYRIMLPLDVQVKLDRTKWQHFIKKVGDKIGVDSDLLPMSQFYFGYANREVLINLDGEDLEASELVKNIDVPKVKTKQLKPNQITDAWDERMFIFSNAYNSRAGKGLHNNIWYATVTAHDMGFSLEQGIALVDDIVDYISDEPRTNYINTLKKRMITVNSEYPHWVEEVKNIDRMA